MTIGFSSESEPKSKGLIEIDFERRRLEVIWISVISSNIDLWNILLTLIIFRSTFVQDLIEFSQCLRISI